MNDGGASGAPERRLNPQHGETETVHRGQRHVTVKAAARRALERPSRHPGFATFAPLNGLIGPGDFQMMARRHTKFTRLLGAAAVVGAVLALSGCYVAPYPYQYRGGGYYGAAPVYVAPYRYGRPYY